MAEEELDQKVLEMAKANHIWINAFDCIRPTDEFKIQLADIILHWLNTKDRLLPLFPESSALAKIGELTPMLYLSINKS